LDSKVFGGAHLRFDRCVIRCASSWKDRWQLCEKETR